MVSYVIVVAFVMTLCKNKFTSMSWMIQKFGLKSMPIIATEFGIFYAS
jgi:hypothetical protein